MPDCQREDMKRNFFSFIRKHQCPLNSATISLFVRLFREVQNDSETSRLVCCPHNDHDDKQVRRMTCSLFPQRHFPSSAITSKPTIVSVHQFATHCFTNCTINWICSKALQCKLIRTTLYFPKLLINIACALHVVQPC